VTLALEAIDSTVFQGLIEYLPFLSRYPGVYSMEILSNGPPKGICAIVVWLHFILGLNVTIYAHKERKYVFFNHEDSPSLECSLKIPSGEDADLTHGETYRDKLEVILYQKSDKKVEEIFRIHEADEDVALESLPTAPMRGYGALTLAKAGSDSERGPVTIELSLIAAGYTLLLLENLHYHQAGRSNSDLTLPADSTLSSMAAQKRFLEAAVLLFDLSPSSGITYFTYESMRKRKSAIPSSLSGAPSAIRAWIESKNDGLEQQEFGWRQLRNRMQDLAQILLALFHVIDMKSCEDLQIMDTPLCYTRIKHPDESLTLGSFSLKVAPDIWFTTMMQLLYSEAFDDRKVPGKTAILSRRGWSVYVNTVDLRDPSGLTTGEILIQRGVPECDGTVRHRIVDGDIDFDAQTSRGAFSHSSTVPDFSQCLVRSWFE
jgi:hypothetical protein